MHLDALINLDNDIVIAYLFGSSNSCCFSLRRLVRHRVGFKDGKIYKKYSHPYLAVIV